MGTIFRCGAAFLRKFQISWVDGNKAQHMTVIKYRTTAMTHNAFKHVMSYHACLNSRVQ